jgi:phage antirepressor YoqD-like protein
MENKELLIQSQAFIIQLTNALQETQNKLLEAQEKITSQEVIITEKTHELKTWNKITDENNWYSGSKIAKMIHEKADKYKAYGRNMIYAILRDTNIFRHDNEPYQSYVDRGYFKMIMKDTGIGAKAVPLVSPKGIDFVCSIIDDYINEGKHDTTN